MLIKIIHFRIFQLIRIVFFFFLIDLTAQNVPILPTLFELWGWVSFFKTLPSKTVLLSSNIRLA